MIFLPVPVCLVGTFSIIVKSSGRFVSSSAPQTPVWLGNTLSPLPGTDRAAVSVLVTRPAGHMGQSTEGAGCQGPLHLYNYYTLTIYCLARVCAL